MEATLKINSLCLHSDTHHTHRTFIHLLTTETLIRKNPGTLEFENFRFSVIFNGGYEHFAFLCLYPEMDKPVKTGLKKQSLIFMLKLGLHGWFSGWRTQLQCRRHRRHGFSPWVRKIPRRRKWQSTPVFLPEKSHGQSSLADYSPRGHKEADITARLSIHIPLN